MAGKVLWTIHLKRAMKLEPLWRRPFLKCVECVLSLCWAVRRLEFECWGISCAEGLSYTGVILKYRYSHQVLLIILAFQHMSTESHCLRLSSSLASTQCSLRLLALWLPFPRISESTRTSSAPLLIFVNNSVLGEAYLALEIWWASHFVSILFNNYYLCLSGCSTSIILLLKSDRNGSVFLFIAWWLSH